MPLLRLLVNGKPLPLREPPSDPVPSTSQDTSGTHSYEGVLLSRHREMRAALKDAPETDDAGFVIARFDQLAELSVSRGDHMTLLLSCAEHHSYISSARSRDLAREADKSRQRPLRRAIPP